ncbi:MAG TPA: type I glyceraldehyde-3-phosphate dehydrogenase [Candidatus Bathyarchaeia archaeon]|nr:type I glyceraldehyde-3-phosphate dehydrogenase [Candidatus Bathyarchaeia archaeon]
MKLKVAINGFGRIGRLLYRAAIERGSNIDFVAINDLTDAKTLAHLLKYDSNYGELKADVQYRENKLIVNGRELEILSATDPPELPWGKLGVYMVVECTGRFTDRESASKHLGAGAKKVLISAPSKNPDATIIFGVNDEKYDPINHNVLSIGSCTTNCLVPTVKVVSDKFGVKRAIFTTAHAITNDQRILDFQHKDLRRARSAGQSIIPTTTGAATTVIEIIPELRNKITGLALRVPVQVVSILDLVAEVEQDVTAEVVNAAFKQEAAGRMAGILDCSDIPLVSVDYKGNAHSSTVDSLLTSVVDDRLVKVLAWYDNEWGFSNRMVDMIERVDRFAK